jgi:catechol 2,3-dioxygenase-like lactoylglutathione lyase family enzyme
MTTRHGLMYGLLATLAFAGHAQAQNRWTYDHMHLAAPDPQKAIEWYVTNLGGKPSDDEGNVVPLEKASRVFFGDAITFLFIKTDKAQPSNGSVIDSIGFSFPDVDAKANEIAKAGGKIAIQPREVPGLWRRGAVDDPWGTEIELVQDPALLGFHHINLRVSDPAASMKFYASAFGGEAGKMKDRYPGVRFGKIWLTVFTGAGTAPSQGHAIDHLGFRPTDMDSAVVDLKAKGVKFTGEPRTNPSNGHKIAFVEGPDGVRIELVQH